MEIPKGDRPRHPLHASKYLVRVLRTLAVFSTLALSLGASSPSVAREARPARLIFEQLLTIPSVYDLNGRFLNGNGNGNDLLELAANGDWPLVTANTPSPQTNTLPNLWWNRNQILRRWGGVRLVEDWVAFSYDIPASEEIPPGVPSALRIIDVQVDRQYWDPLAARTRFRHDARQYSLLNQWGTTASSYGYHLRLYRSGRVVGIYSCDFSDRPEFNQPPITEVPVDQLGNLSCYAQLGPFVSRQPPLEAIPFTAPGEIPPPDNSLE